MPDCVYLTPGLRDQPERQPGVTQTALSPTFGLVGEPGVYTEFPRRYRLEQGIEVQHALLPRLSLTGTYYHGENKNLTKTVNRGRTDDGTRGTQYRAVTLFNPIDGTPYRYYNADRHAPDRQRHLPRAAAQETVRLVHGRDADAAVRRRAAVGGHRVRRAALDQGLRTLVRDRRTGAPAIVDPNTLRFCDEWNLVAYPGGPVIGKPFTKNFKLSGAFPIVYGINLGVSYQNIDSGDVAPTLPVRCGLQVSGRHDDLQHARQLDACSRRARRTYGCVPERSPSARTGCGAAAGNADRQLQFRVSR